MIVDYENPLKKMMEEFVPHGKVRELFYNSVVYRLLCSFQMPLTIFWRLLRVYNVYNTGLVLKCYTLCFQG